MNDGRIKDINNGNTFWVTGYRADGGWGVLGAATAGSGRITSTELLLANFTYEDEAKIDISKLKKWIDDNKEDNHL